MRPRLPTPEEDARWNPHTGIAPDPAELGRLSIECAPADGRGQRVVVATLGKRFHRDRFDADNEFHRRKFREAVVEKFGLSDDAHEAIESQLLAAADAEDVAAASGPAAPLERLSFAELRAAHPTLHPPVIDGLLRAGETCNVISTSKAGKSWLVYGLALSVVTGRPWLDRFATASGKVLLIDNELHKPTLAHRIPVVAEAMGIDAERFDLDLEVVSLRGRLRSLGELSIDLAAVEPGEFKLIVMDAKYRFAAAGVSENDNAAETQVYNLLDEIAERTKAGIVLVHHATKGSQSDKRVTDVGAGAGAQSRAADCHLVLREHEEEGVCVLDAAVRSFAPVKSLALRWQFPLWEPALDVDPAKLKGRLTQGEQRQADRDAEGMAAVVNALRKAPLTKSKLRGRTGFGPDKLVRLVAKLQKSGAITSRAVTVRGNSTLRYKLADPSE